jgi:flagellin FlaB
MLVTYTSGTVSEVITFAEGEVPNAGEWAVIEKYNPVTENNLLEPGEQFVLKIVFPNSAELKPNTPFSVNLQPAVGAVYPIKKTVPAYLNKVNTLN